jgi:hypothetical protein
MNGVEEDGCATYCRMHNKFWMDQQASKTQGTLPGALQTSHVEGAVNKPANEAGWDKEGVQSRSVAPGG